MKAIYSIFILTFSVNAFSLCNFSVSSSGITETVGSTNVEVVESLSASRPPGTDLNNCGYAYFFFSKGNANSYNRRAFNSQGESISYNLYKGMSKFGTLKDPYDFNNSNEYLSTYLQYPNSTIQNQFYFYLPAVSNSTMTRGGTYTDNININVFRGGVYSPWAYFEFNRTIPITIVVPKVINISLVDSGQNIDLNSTYKNLDFGTLETNEEMSFDLMVASNAGYRISFSSLNNGKLDNLQRGIKLDYTVKVAGSNINLSNSSTIPTLVAQGSGITGNAGTRIPVNVKIGTVNDNQWGDYQDYITITAATND
jgi:hypothetical protein